MADTLRLRTSDVMSGLAIKIRMPHSLAMRTKLAIWLIALAGRVLTVPCEIEFTKADDQA